MIPCAPQKYVQPPANDSEDFFVIDALEFHLENNANYPFYSFANSDIPSSPSTITYLEFVRAAHRLAHVLRPNRSGVEGEIVALLINTDTILYQAIVAGLIVAGCVPFPISPRNSANAVVELLERTLCRRILVNETAMQPILDGVKSLIASNPLFGALQIEELPGLVTAYPHLTQEVVEDHFERYNPPSKRPSKNDILMILHSSGSTGTPKPISQTHAFWMQLCSGTDFREYTAPPVIACMALPSFHAFGVGMQLLFPLYHIMTIAVYPPATTSLPVVPSAENILDHTKRSSCNILFVTPAFLQIWSTLPKAVEFLKTMESVIYGGGPLAPKIGNLLTEAGVRVHPVYGGTEFGSPTYINPRAGDEKEWQYMRFRENVRVRWASEGDGRFECQYLAWEKHVLMVENLADTRGFACSDIFEPHPTKKGLWKIVARKDEVLIHSSGEKTVPGPMELIVLSDPLVQGAIIFGRAQAQTGILIEPTPGNRIDVNDHGQLAVLRNKLWPVIDEANKDAPAFSRIFKEMIVITSNDKPLPRAGKGSVMRKAAISLYEPEISALYESIESNKSNEEMFLPTWSVKDFELWMVKQTLDLTSRQNISAEVDLFEQGFDSLCATFLRLRIVSVLRSSNDKAIQKVGQEVTQNLVYSYPTIKGLAAYITSLYLSPSPSGDQSYVSRGTASIEEMIAKYSSGLEVHLPQNSRSAALATVLLTGSTGHLGSQLLAMLLQDERVEKVFAFNRPSSKPILDRHVEKFKDIGLDELLLESNKLILMTGDTSQSALGLDQESYHQLSQSVNIVIHNAWRLNFNLGLTAFEPNVRGTRNLIDIVRSGPNTSDARFLFVSSIGTALSWDKSKGSVPEDIVEDPSIALGTGYGESKYIAERVLAKSGLQATVFRVGQISGGRPKGSWPTTEWVPILVKSSITLGILPDAGGVASWLSATAISATIVDVALMSRTTAVPRALNLVHPRPTKWMDIMNNIRSAIKEVLGHDLRLVPFGEWVSAIEARSENATTETLETLPAIKLLAFFQGLAAHPNVSGPTAYEEVGGTPTFSTEKLFSVSNVMRPDKLPMMQPNDAKLWIEYWYSIGFLA